MTAHPDIASLAERAVDPAVPVDELRQIADQSLELARLVATNLGADSALLAHLASKQDQTVLANLASHPGLPMELMITVGQHAPQKLWENPAFSLWMLEHGYAIDQFINRNFYGYINMVQHPDMPAEFLRYIVKFGRANGHVVAHPNAPVDLIEELVNHSLDDPISLDPVPGSAATNPRTPAHLLERIFEHVAPEVSKQTLFFAQNIKADQYKTLMAIASHPNASPTVLQKLANYPNDNVRRAAMNNPNFAP